MVRLEIPPLRDRREDIPLLVHHFMAKYRGSEARIEGIEAEALATLVDAEWPGNIRQLENVVESAMALANGPLLRRSDLPRLAGSTRGAAPVDLPLSLDAYERCALERALGVSEGDVSGAARLLGIGRSTLYRKLARHGLDPRQR